MENNPVEPLVEQVERVLQNSHRIWMAYEREAGDDTSIVEACFQPRELLGATPTFPKGWLCECECALEHPKLESDTTQLFLTGNASWVTSTNTCRLEPKQLPQSILAGISEPRVINLQDGTCFDEWPGVRNQTSAAKGNYLTVLTAAWAYLFSVKWLELSTHCSTARGITYTKNFKSPKYAHSVELEFGNVSNEAARWWQALLAPGQGWNAAINFKGREFHSPWAVSLSGEQTFSLITHSTQTLCEDTPDFETSLRFLIDFCDFHGVHDQCLAALSVAILLPTLESTVSLPRPKSCPSRPINSLFSGLIGAAAVRIPFYMVLSGNSKGTMALLSGAFFNPAVPCNLVSPWLQPIFDILDPMIQAGRFIHILNIVSIRQPRLAFLWLGAIIVGVNRLVMQMARYGTPPVSLHAAAWTRTSHSFIDMKPKLVEGWKISRKDECRLLFSTNLEFSRVPICPWKPFGYVQLEDTEFEIRWHSRCGHTFEYIGWRWNGISRLDKGYCSTQLYFRCGLISKYIGWAWNLFSREHPSGSTRDLGKSESIELVSFVASKTATKSIFSWYRNDGWARSEMNIYTHLWFQSKSTDDESEAEASGEVRKNYTYIYHWLDQVSSTDVFVV